jgi:hypothetical protein
MARVMRWIPGVSGWIEQAMRLTTKAIRVHERRIELQDARHVLEHGVHHGG